MSRFKEGDIVICIDNFISSLTLSIDKHYTVLDKRKRDSGEYIWIINDRGERDFFGCNRFISIIDKRCNTIDEVLNEES